MKKVLILLLVLSGVTAKAAVFQSQEFLNAGVVSLVISNTVGYTNTIPYLGITGAYSTNTAGLVYTNNLGTQITVASGLSNICFAVTNGIVVCTNDQSFLVKDVPNESDYNGNIHTNFNFSFSIGANATTTGSVNVVFYPIIKGPLSGGPGGVTGVSPFPIPVDPELIDLSNPIQFNVGILRGGITNVILQPITGSTPAGAKGWRLQSITVTNAAGNVTIFDISRNTFIP